MKNMLLVFIFFLLSSFLYSIIRNVPDDYLTIQAGINRAADNDTVLVQPGTYVENINYNGKLITVGSLFLTTQDTTYISQTVIDGNSIGSVVTFENSEDSTVVLCGFTITNGSSTYGGGVCCINSSSPNLKNLIISGNIVSNHGGGINCYSFSSPILENVTIIDNYAYVGGGIFCNSSSPILENVTISNNDAYIGGGISCYANSNLSLQNVIISGNSSTDNGGGIYCEWYSNPNLQDVTISNNSTDGDGGGIYIYNYSDPNLQNVTITGNIAVNGGGIYCEECSSPIIENVTINDNIAVNGGGIHCQNNSNPSLQDVTISSNGATAVGGGVYCYFSSSPSLQNVTITGNSALIDGGGMCCEAYCSPNLKNVTITSNSALNDGGGIFCHNESNPTLINSILWNDSPSEIFYYGGSISVIYSDIQGGYAGTGNINSDPLFVNPSIGDYHLSWVNFPVLDSTKSPCIDTGNPASLLDPDGTIIEMGAYHYNQSSSGKAIIINIKDVPNDQGRSVTVTWQKSYWDHASSIMPIAGYSLWEKYPYELDRDCTITNDINEAIEKEDTYFQREDTTWVHIDYVPAMQWEEYSALSETFFDSTTTGDYLSYFFVSAHLLNQTLYFNSSVASGYSVDNIAPDETEMNITRNGSNMNLNWDEVEYGSYQGNSYPEVNGIWYNIYAGDSPDFICDEAHLIDTVTNLNYDYLLTGEDKKFFKIVVSDQP